MSRYNPNEQSEASTLEQFQRWAEYLDVDEKDKEVELRRIKELERLLRQYKKELTKW